MNVKGLFCASLMATALGACASSRPSGPIDGSGPRPNILLIVADDLGYADLGCYGSEISTPNLDALAREGIRFSQFHTAPYCAPTRAMLLSGNNNHVAGMAHQGRQGILDQPFPGYENCLSDRVVPFPKLLQRAGYHTSMVGKWHLGVHVEHSPTSAGFKRSFAILEGAGNHWDAMGFFEGGSTYWEDGAPTVWPRGRYSTDLYTEKLIGYIDEAHVSGRPFLAFAAYTSPHWPLQVPEVELDRYSGQYDDGYDRLRERRFESLKEAEIIRHESVLPPRNPDITPWGELGQEQRRREARKMELYSAMVENLDQHVGRLIGRLKDHGLYESTLIIVMSDNGAAGEDFYNGSEYMDYVRANYDNAFENMGRPGSFVSYGPPWAEAGSAPFSRYKGFMREGGIVAPMIISGPGVLRRGVIDRSYLTVMDLAPTILEVAGGRYPDRSGIEPMLGQSMAQLLAGEVDAVHDDTYVTTQFHSGRAFIRRGRWKLTSLDRPFDEDHMELFDVVSDPGETTDLASARPDIYEEMLELWRSERRRFGIVLPEDL